MIHDIYLADFASQYVWLARVALAVAIFDIHIKSTIYFVINESIRICLFKFTLKRQRK